MQYYADPQHYGISELSRGFEALLNNTGMICNINIIGGEPFLYKYLPELFETIDRVRHKYLRLNIITNGTVVPPDGVVCAMKKYNVVCMISDYGIHSRNIQKVVDKMKAFDVPVLVNKDDWQYMAQISGRVDYGEQAQQKYDECNIPCRTIRNGRFYKCEFLANGDNLSVFPHDEKNYVDLNAHVSKAVLAEYLHRSEYYPGCAFCSGSNGKEALIPAAEQVSSRLELFGIASTERDETIETTE
jgi:hypothetical protein